MRQQAVEVATALLDDLGQADDLGAGAHDDQELKAAVVFELNHYYLPWNSSIYTSNKLIKTS